MRFLCAATLLSVLAGAHAHAQTPAETRLLNRTGIIYSKSVDKIYVVNEGSNSVSVISRHSPVKEVHVGSHPESLAVNDATGKLYVANADDRSISVIDGRADQVITTVPLPARPYSIAIDQQTNIVYVPDASSTIDGETNAVSPSNLGASDAILVDASRRRFYLMGYESDSITVFNIDTHVSQKLAAGGFHLWGFGQLDDTLFVTRVQDANLAAINIETGALQEIPTGAMPCAVAIDARVREIYVANYRDGSVTVVNLRNNRLNGTVRVGGRPQAIAVDPDERLVYVADTLNRSVTVFDARSRRVVDVIKTEESPYALLLDAPTHTVYAATLGAHGFVHLRTTAKPY